MKEAQKKAFGDAVTEETLNPFMWVCKSHYYSSHLSFYNFPYAFGGLFARGLYLKAVEGREEFLKKYMKEGLAKLGDEKIMFKLTIPTVENFYADIMEDPHVVRVVALSGGYTREHANELLAKNHGLIASFSRALVEGLVAQMSDEEFNAKLDESVRSVYEASIQ